MAITPLNKSQSRLAKTKVQQPTRTQGLNQARDLQNVADLTKLHSNKRDKLAKLFSDYDTETASYSKKELSKAEAQPKDLKVTDAELYSAMRRHGKLVELRNKNKSYQTLDSNTRQNYLEQMAGRPEIIEVLRKMCNELVVTHDDANTFAEIKVAEIKLEEYGFDEKTIAAVSKNVKDTFSDVYRWVGFSRTGAWNHMYDFLKQGKKAFHIIWDDPANPKLIMNMFEVDYDSLEEHYDDGQRFWIHTKKDFTAYNTSNQWIGGNAAGQSLAANQVLLYDHQIVRVSWSEDKIDSPHTSYLEQLIKPYNFMRILDETKIVWAVTNATFRTHYAIPTSNQGRNRSEQTVSEFIDMYKDKFTLDAVSGDVTVNGENNLMFNKDHFTAKGDSGDPEITTLGGDGPDMQTMEPNEYMAKKYYRASGMPLSRFDPSSSDAWNLDPTSIYREEIDFGRYLAQIREIFSMIIIKPVLFQLAASIPELHDEPQIAECIFLKYTSYSRFTRMMEQEMMKAEFEFVKTIRDSLTMQIGDEEIPLLPMNFILKKYLDYDEETLKNIDQHRDDELVHTIKIEARRMALRKEYGLPDDLTMQGITAPGEDY